jgi:hypothetical protein
VILRRLKEKISLLDSNWILMAHSLQLTAEDYNTSL